MGTPVPESRLHKFRLCCFNSQEVIPVPSGFWYFLQTMSTDSDVLLLMGNDWTLKVARVVPQAIVYGTRVRFILIKRPLTYHGTIGAYFILMAFLYNMQLYVGSCYYFCLLLTRRPHSRDGFRMRASNAFLIAIATLLFLGATLFLSLDVADLVERMKIILIRQANGPPLEVRLRLADSKLKEIVWTEELLFILMVNLHRFLTLFPDQPNHPRSSR
jgi:hypothetical protein